VVAVAHAGVEEDSDDEIWMKGRRRKGREERQEADRRLRMALGTGGGA
jgi:hypothetical protein